MTIHGHCDPRFHLLQDEFARNFAERGEVGASLCVVLAGETVVDLWGGLADRRSNAPWQRDTIGVVFSCTKGAVALCAHVLAARNQLDLDAPVSRYWPEFAVNGKENTRVRWLLDHQAGLPAIRTPLRVGAIYDWAEYTAALAAEPPFWSPGTRQGYGAATMGHLVGEVIRRASGQDVASYFRNEIAEPLGLDFHLGLAEEHEPRVAPTIKPDALPRGEVVWRFLEVANREPESIQGLIVRNTGRPFGDTDSRQAHAAVLPSSGGITNARGLAGLYAPLANGELLPPAYLTALQEVSSASGCDATLLVGMRFALGFMKSADNRRGPAGAQDSVILSPTAFGHAGMGGSLGFADPAVRLAFGYTMNKQGRGVLLNARGQGLVDAVYRSLGRREYERGFWV